jgi:1-acyl-sn-glycerol-3-phosphate acyltransferase
MGDARGSTISDAAPGDLCDGRHLAARDPDYLRSIQPLLEFTYRHYFRVQATGVENLPLRGPALLVGNHSGGIVAPDAAMTTCLWVKERGLEPAAYALIDPGIFSMDGVRTHVSKCGGLRAEPRMAIEALESGGVVLVYPGGADDAFRPYSKRNDIQLGGNQAFIKLALRYRVPIVPIVTSGAHDTLMILDDGKELAKMLGLDKRGIERLPISLALPLGLTVGVSFHIPFPAQIKIAVGEPIEFRGFRPEDAKNRAAVAGCFELVLQEMRELLNGLLASG